MVKVGHFFLVPDISYDWRGMPTEFVRNIGCYDYHGFALCDSVKLVMAYDGSGRRISKTRMMKTAADGDWYVDNVTHYTGIGTEVRESYFGGALENAKVVVNMPQGLGRYGADDAVNSRGNGRSFEWYLKNHLGSTMLVYGTQWVDDENLADVGAPLAAYDYRAFGEQVTLSEPTDKVTENFTGKEKDDETELNYFGARYLDPMLGLWISVDPKRQFASPYLYAGNGVNPVNGVDGDGNVFVDDAGKALYQKALNNNFWGNKDIENAYRFANETKTEISIEHKGVIRNGPIETLAGKTIPGLLDQVAVFLHLADDNRTLNSARVQLSETGTENWSATLGISFDEAEARIATHEFEAHIRNFTPYADESGKHPVDIEHDKINGIEKRLFPE